ncbi:tRNA lysidine(34) synthetase TilS [Mongoliitalea daihaiensis]|uniref:tRNA lysidine(34) synthetase TilS n=1 Tax=Mongoliitalea daihaiensis TaxID=2782006 RepID=UPI001F43613C|nr:tRNA lysidine(34) synthetase TilS [Mongoliitalea daihaiensis]UJP65479.1 tRNA lysidine(34) synthetase TilS [Mongoliitalea daihaiensis]
MLGDFISYIRSKNLLDPQKKYLLAISGGVDSVALGHLLHLSGITFDVATVNFNLRGTDSEEDFTFVQGLATRWGVGFHGQVVPLEVWDKLSNESIQMKARTLRYEWLEDLVIHHAYEAVLVAHHFEDQLETIWLHLLRGCGIDGIYGMAERRGHIIRPLLNFRKESLVTFMESNGFTWREDRSNQKDIYQRNFIRNQVLAQVEQGFPKGLKQMAESFGRIKDTGKAFHHLYERWKNEEVVREGEYEYLKISSFKTIPGRHSMLFYWLRDTGFSSAQVEDILQAVDDNQVGKLFHSFAHTLNVDRENLLLGNRKNEFLPFEIEHTDVACSIHGQGYDILRIQKNSFVDHSSENAMMDVSSLIFPLKVRNWELGDRFLPLGMNKEKKISDFLVDLKVSMIQKRDVKVMLSGEKIVWVIGLRISELVKLKGSTQEVIYFKKKAHP